MKKRNVKKIISESGSLYNRYYSITVSEIQEIIKMADCVISAVGYGFQYGYVLGSRAERKRHENEK